MLYIFKIADASAICKIGKLFFWSMLFKLVRFIRIVTYIRLVILIFLTYVRSVIITRGLLLFWRSCRFRFLFILLLLFALFFLFILGLLPVLILLSSCFCCFLEMIFRGLIFRFSTRIIKFPSSLLIRIIGII